MAEVDDDELRRQLERLGITGAEDDSIRIDPETGKVQVEHWYGNTDTGIVIDPETGKVQEEHWYGNTDTGTVIDPETGKVQEEHWYGNTDTGTVIDPETGKVQEEHWYGNTDTGVVIDPATGKVQEEHWYGNTDLRQSPRANVEPKDSHDSNLSEGGHSANHSGTSASAPGASGASGTGLGWIGAAIIVMICFAVAHDWHSAPTMESRSSAVAKVPPAQLVDRGACPYEGCTYGERWMAQRDVDVYFAPPDSVGTPLSSLQKKAVIRAGEWVRTETGLVLAMRHEGQVDNDVTVRVNRDPNYQGVMALKKGQTIYLYSYLGEGCWTSWAEGHYLSVCNATSRGTPQNEWWIKIKTADGSEAWTASADKAFMSEEGLNSELGKKIEDPKMPLPDKLAQIDALLKGGADLNGEGGRYGTTPIDAAVKTQDVELIKMLISKGLNLGKSCPAYVATQTALGLGGELTLEVLLENGMKLDCLTEPPLIAFLGRGLASEDYPVDRAIKVAEVLVKNGAIVKQQDLEGRSILDVLDDLPANATSRVASLREGLNRMAADQPPPPPRTPKILPSLSAAATAEFALAPGSPFTVGRNPLGVAVGDFNGDDRPDIAIASTPVMIMIGTGSGGFVATAGSPFRMVGGSKSVAVGDFNRDGTPDVAILAYSNGKVFDSTVTVLLGSGTGGFTAAPGNSFVVVGGQVSGLVSGDFNGDGKPDLATASSLDGTVTVLLGDGTGGFTGAPGSPLKVGASPHRLVVGDFNRDGWPDLAVAHDFSSNLTLLLGTRAGSFTAAPGSPFTVGSRPLPLAVGDFNGDGRLDLAVGNFGGDSVTVLLGNGAGGFTAAPGSPFKVGKNPEGLAVGDFDGDGRLDLAAGSDPMVVLLGNGAGGFSASPGSPLKIGSHSGSVAVGDFNGDGKPDLAIANFEDSTVMVLLNRFPGSGLRSR